MYDRLIKFNGEEYHGYEDLIRRADFHYTVVQKDTGQIMNPYEFFWKMLKAKLQEEFEENERKGT